MEGWFGPMNKMAIAHQRWMRSSIIKAWRDRTRTIQVLADLVCGWAAADETTIHLDVVAFRNVQQLDARTTVLADKRIMELPTETKLSWIARSLGVATRQARISGRLRSPKDLSSCFPGIRSGRMISHCIRQPLTRKSLHSMHSWKAAATLNGSFSRLLEVMIGYLGR